MRNYRRIHLEGTLWHKVTVRRGLEQHARIRDWLNGHLPDENFMYKSVMDNMIILFNNFEDFVLARLMFDFTSKELRGCTNWAKGHDANHLRWLVGKYGLDHAQRMMARSLQKREANKAALINREQLI